MVKLESIEKDLSIKASNLYFFFGGISAGILMPPFEFYNAAKIIDENKIFIRDFDQSWYQNGLPGIGENILSISGYIKKEIQSLKPEKVFFVGNSMGGYAAILFATLVGDGNVIAFAPQTFISPILRTFHRDRRWSRLILKTYKNSFFKRKVWNLRPLLLNKKQIQKISIFVSKDHRLDYTHAEHVMDIPGVDIYKVNGQGHQIVRDLRDQGKLQDIMSGNYSDLCSYNSGIYPVI